MRFGSSSPVDLRTIVYAVATDAGDEGVIGHLDPGCRHARSRRMDTVPDRWSCWPCASCVEVPTFEEMSKRMIKDIRSDNAHEKREQRPYRWVKVGEQWLVDGPAVDIGATIEIRKQDGSLVQAVVTGMEPGGFTVRKADA